MLAQTQDFSKQMQKIWCPKSTKKSLWKKSYLKKTEKGHTALKIGRHAMNFYEDFEFLVQKIVGVPEKSLLHSIMTFGYPSVHSSCVSNIYFSGRTISERQGSHKHENLSIDRSWAPLYVRQRSQIFSPTSSVVVLTRFHNTIFFSHPCGVTLLIKNSKTPRRRLSASALKRSSA